MTGLGRYRIIEEVGHGGMSVVYRAFDTALEREVALKVLYPFLAANEDARRRFCREARTVARLRHPNILEIYDYSGEESRENFIATEFIHGSTLRQLPVEHTSRFPEIAAMITAVICRALDHAHNSGVIHRDVKPENVMISEKGTIKLMDFGLAFLADSQRLTTTGTLLGSPAHMAPELLDGKVADRRADVFSLGTILYWLATGEMPFRGETAHALLRKISDCEYRPPEAVNPAVGDGIAGIVRKALARSPDERYQNAGEMLAVLEADLLLLGIEGEISGNLSDFFANPDGYCRDFEQNLKKILLRNVDEALKSGRLLAALRFCNRLLVLEPGNPDALRRLRSISSRRHARRILKAGVALGAAAALFAVAGAYIHSSGFLKGLQINLRPSIQAQPQKGQQAESLAAAALTNEPEKTSPLPPQHESSSRPQPPLKENAKGAGEQLPQSQAEELPPREVNILVSPWADMYVDGQLVAKATITYTAQLRPGKHEIRFVNPYHYEKRIKLDVPAEGTAPEIRQKLEVKPAYIAFRNAQNADVYVDGQYKGQASDSLADPVQVAVDPRTGKKKVEVRLKKDGFKMLTRVLTLSAGRTETVEAELEKE